MKPGQAPLRLLSFARQNRLGGFAVRVRCFGIVVTSKSPQGGYSSWALGVVNCNLCGSAEIQQPLNQCPRAFRITQCMKPLDLQVNGYGGVDFNQDNLSLEQLLTACQRVQADGVGGILATIITEQLPLMERRIRRLVELRGQHPLLQEVIVGLHIEGPFISSPRRLSRRASARCGPARRT